MARRYAMAGWIAGFVLGSGWAMFGWANPYVGLSVWLSGVALTVTAMVATRGEHTS